MTNLRIALVTRGGFVDPEAVPAALETLVEDGTSERPPFIAIRSVSGAVARVAEDATAYAHRRAELMVVTTIVGPAPVVDAARPGFAAVWDRLAPDVSGLYANFLSTATDEDVAGVYPASTYQRLAAAKRRYDPGNLFAGNHNVRP